MGSLVVIYGAVFLLTAMLAAYYPVAGLVAYSCVIPLENISLVGFLSPVKPIGIAAVYGLTLSYLARRISTLNIPGLLWPSLAYFLACLCSWTFCGQSTHGTQLLITLGTVTATSLFLAAALRNSGDVRAVLWGLSLSSLVYAVLLIALLVERGLLQLSPSQISTFRVTYPLHDPNYLSIYLTVGMLAAITLAEGSAGKRRRVFFFSVGLVIMAGVLSTLSRTGLVAMVMGSFVLFRLARRSNRVIILAILLAAFVMLSGRPDLWGGRFLRMGDPAVRGRLAAWMAGFGMWMQHPILGVGFGRFAECYPMYVAPDSPVAMMVAHSSWVSVLAETGLLGMVAWFAVVGAGVSCALRAVRLAQGTEDRLLASFVAGMLASLLAASFALSVHVNKMFWLVVVLADRLAHFHPRQLPSRHR